MQRSLLIAALTITAIAALAAKPTKAPPQTSPWITRAVTYKSSGTSATVTPDGVVHVPFPLCPSGAGPFAQVTTTSALPLGNLSGATLEANITITSTGLHQFTYWGMGVPGVNVGPFPAHARLVFMTRSGFSTSWGPEVWYSNPVRVDLATGQFLLTESLADFTKWSSGQGKAASAYPADFAYASSHVAQIGLSFGGGTFFDVGVGVIQGTGTATIHFNYGIY